MQKNDTMSAPKSGETNPDTSIIVSPIKQITLTYKKKKGLDQLDQIK